MHYRVVHRSIYEYSVPVSRCYHEAHLLARNTAGQLAVESAVRIDPTPGTLRERRDFFGNRAVYFELHQPHHCLEIVAESRVSVYGSPPAEAGAAALAWEEARDRLAHVDRAGPLGVEPVQFTLPSPRVPLVGELLALTDTAFAPGRPLLEAVTELTGQIQRDFAYDTGFSSVHTPLAEVISARRGVCQDFAHLAVACLRVRGLAARYVSGYLETRPPPGQPRLQGVDASHAWFSVYLPGSGWRDFDPTNGQAADQRYITVAWGRDYADVAPVKGVIFGGGSHGVRVAVDVEREPEPDLAAGSAPPDRAP